MHIANSALVLLMLSTSVALSPLHAEPACSRDDPATTFAKNLQKAIGKDESHLHTVTSQDIAKAVCRPSVGSNDDLQKSLRSQFPLSTDTEGSHGYDFTGEDPNLVKVWDKLMTNTLDKPVKAKGSSKCHDVFCAVQNEFGKREGMLLLSMMASQNVDASHLSMLGDFSKWNADQLEILAQTVADYPLGILNFKYPIRAVHNRNGQVVSSLDIGKASDLCAPASSANGNTTFYDCWEHKDKLASEETAFHEFAHDIAVRRVNMDGSDEWLALSGWKVTKGPVDKKGLPSFISESSKPDCLVTPYARFNEKEDFAESLVIYRFKPEVLQKSCPAKYEFIKNKIFNGIEYTSEAACKGKTVDNGQLTSQAL